MRLPITIQCDCGQLLDLPDDFFVGGAMIFWQAHGHFPKTVTYHCPCGASRTWESPEDVPAFTMWDRDEAFYRAHRSHATGRS